MSWKELLTAEEQAQYERATYCETHFLGGPEARWMNEVVEPFARQWDASRLGILRWEAKEAKREPVFTLPDNALVALFIKLLQEQRFCCLLCGCKVQAEPLPCHPERLDDDDSRRRLSVGDLCAGGKAAARDGVRDVDWDEEPDKGDGNSADGP